MRITSTMQINLPMEQIFWHSQDYSRRLEWDTYLAEARLLDGKSNVAVGVQSYCKNKSGSVLVSKYVSFAPPTHAAVQMTKGPWILSRFSGTWRFKRLAPTRTEVRFIYHFKCRPAVLSWFLEPIVGSIYKRDMQRRLIAFKRWTESQA